MVAWRLIRQDSEVGCVQLDGNQVTIRLPPGIPEDVERYFKSGVWVDPETGDTFRCPQRNVAGYWDFHLIGTGGPYLPWEMVLREPSE